MTAINESAFGLAAAMGPPRRVVATLIPVEHAQRLKRILFALPPVSLRGHRVGITEPERTGGAVSQDLPS